VKSQNAEGLASTRDRRPKLTNAALDLASCRVDKVLKALSDRMTVCSLSCSSRSEAVELEGVCAGAARATESRECTAAVTPCGAGRHGFANKGMACILCSYTVSRWITMLALTSSRKDTQHTDGHECASPPDCSGRAAKRSDVRAPLCERGREFAAGLVSDQEYPSDIPALMRHDATC
jgi:hypothetical protein